MLKQGLGYCWVNLEKQRKEWGETTENGDKPITKHADEVVTAER